MDGDSDVADTSVDEADDSTPDNEGDASLVANPDARL